MRQLPAINVPDHIENEGAYIAAAQRRIMAGWAKAAEAKKAAWIAADPSRVPMMEAMAKMADWEWRKSENGEPGFMGKMLQSINEWGTLSPKQEEAVRASLKRSEERRAARLAEQAETKMVDQEVSQHVGIVGARAVYSLRMRRAVEFVGNFGPAVVNEMVDADGNVFVYIGGAKLADVGQTINVKATIKRHGEREGVKQTALSRPVVQAAK